jgi:hypothetical protein
MTLTVDRSGERVRCENCPRTVGIICPRTVGIIHGDKLFVKARDQMVVTDSCSIVCKCKYVNHVSLRKGTDS